MSKPAKSHNVFGGITLSEKPLKMEFQVFSMTEFINAEVFTKGHKGKDLPKMSVDSFLHFSISERLHVDKKFFSKHPDFKFDKLNDRIRTQVNEYIKENKTSDLLFTEKHVKYIRNCYAFLLGKYGNTHMNEKFEYYDDLIEEFIFDCNPKPIESIVNAVTEDINEDDDEVVKKKKLEDKDTLRNDIFIAFTVVTVWTNNRWQLYLEEKTVEEKAAKETKEKQEAEEAVRRKKQEEIEAARRKEQEEFYEHQVPHRAEWNNDMMFDGAIKKGKKRMNRKGKSVAGKK